MPTEVPGHTPVRKRVLNSGENHSWKAQAAQSHSLKPPDQETSSQNRHARGWRPLPAVELWDSLVTITDRCYIRTLWSSCIISYNVSKAYDRPGGSNQLEWTPSGLPVRPC